MALNFVALFYMKSIWCRYLEGACMLFMGKKENLKWKCIKHRTNILQRSFPLYEKNSLWDFCFPMLAVGDQPKGFLTGDIQKL